MKSLNIRNAFTQDTALLLLRLIVGTVFVFHGAQKTLGILGGHGISGFAGFLGSLGIPFPTVSAWLAGGAELLGGLALIAGVGVGLASIPLTFTMLVASFVVHGKAFSAANNGMEYPLTLAVVTAAIGLLGAGRFSLAVWRK